MSSVLQNDLQILPMLESIRNRSFFQSLKCVSLWGKWVYMFCQRYRKCYIEYDSTVVLCQMGLHEGEKTPLLKNSVLKSFECFHPKQGIGSVFKQNKCCLSCVRVSPVPLYLSHNKDARNPPLSNLLCSVKPSSVSSLLSPAVIKGDSI